MTIKSLKPSLAFNGNCAKAIALYEMALGAKVEQLVHFGDGEKMGHPFDSKDKALVLNAVLRIGGGELMMMDSPRSRTVPTESNVQIFLDFDDVAQLEKSFGALAEGGKVNMPIADTFWGSRFGMVADAFGIHWMLSHELRKGAK